MRFRLAFLLLFATTSLFAVDPSKLAAARQLLDNNQFPDAMAAFEKLAVTEPDNAELNYWLGLTALMLNDPDKSISYLEKATSIDPKQARYFDQLGDAYGVSTQRASLFSQIGLAKKCIAAYDKAVALEPDNVEYRKSRYEFYRAAPSIVGGGTDKAMAEMLEIEKRDPVQGGGMRADLKMKENKPDEAFAILRALEQKYPDSKVARYLFGRLVAMTGDKLDEGIAALKDYFTYSPKPSEPPVWAAHWRLAMILERKGSVADARSQYEEALKLNPSFDRAREALKRLSK